MQFHDLAVPLRTAAGILGRPQLGLPHPWASCLVPVGVVARYPGSTAPTVCSLLWPRQTRPGCVFLLSEMVPTRAPREQSFRDYLEGAVYICAATSTTLKSWRIHILASSLPLALPELRPCRTLSRNMEIWHTLQFLKPHPSSYSLQQVTNPPQGSHPAHLSSC